jgi:hypothetical protein
MWSAIENQSECLLIYLHDHMQKNHKNQTQNKHRRQIFQQGSTEYCKQKQAQMEYNATSAFSTNVSNFLKFEMKQGSHFIYRVLVK